jgi:hypothetical protein
MIGAGEDNKDDHIVQEVEQKSDEIITYIKQSKNFMDKAQEIFSFVETKANYCKELIEKSKYKNCLFILIKLNEICLKTVMNKPKECKEDISAVLKDVETFIENAEATKSESVKIDLYKYTQYLKNFDGIRPSAINVKDKISAFYVRIMELLGDVINNIGCIYYKRNRVDRSLYYFNLAAQIFMRLKANTENIAIQYIITIVNMVYALNDNEKEGLDASGQLVCNSIMLMENIETRHEDTPSGKPDPFDKINLPLKSIANLIELHWNKKPVANFGQNKTGFYYKLACYYDYYAGILEKTEKTTEADFAREQSLFLLKQIEKLEKTTVKKEERKSELTKDNVNRFSVKKQPEEVTNDAHLDNFSALSFKTGMTATSVSTNLASMSKLSKENILYQKYVDVQNTKFKIIIAHLKELKCLEVIVYSKPKNMLKKLFLNFQECLNYAKQNDMSLDSDADAKKLLNKVARLLYFKDGELFIKEIPYANTLEELLRT